MQMHARMTTIQLFNFQKEKCETVNHKHINIIFKLLLQIIYYLHISFINNVISGWSHCVVSVT
jgi:hypothetical protein